MGDAALSDVRVIDASQGVAGAIATMFMADFGADVVKLEPPGGDPARRRPGSAVWDRGKRSVVVDEATAAGRDRAATLVAGADVLVVTDASAALTDLAAESPGLVVLALPAYLELGRPPWAGAESDGLLAATTGVALRQASFDGGPIDSIYPHLLVVQGVWAAAAATAALIERGRSGAGQTVTVGGLHGVMIASAAAFTFDRNAADVVAARPGGPGGSVPFYRTYQCGDGEWLFLAALTPVFTDIAFRTLGVDDLFDDPRLDGGGRAAILKPENAAWVIERIATVFKTGSRDEWFATLSAAGCPVGRLLHRERWLDHPQIDAIGMRVEVDDPARGRVTMPGVPIRLTDGGGEVRGPAPQLGQHDAAVAWPPRPTVVAADAVPTGDGPLAGVRVLDLGAIIAGPFTASLLGELGAEVVKVEPLTGDSFRGPGFAAYNKGQRGVSLDLRHPDGRAALLRLVRDADVVVDNYRPGVLGRLGITYDDLREANPEVVTISITGFGEGGPLSGEAGFDPVLQAMSGMMTAQGGDSDPVFFTVPVNDVTAAASGALAVCLALLRRQRTGRGQRVWTSLAAMSALLQIEHLVRWPGRPPAPTGGRDHRGPSHLDRYYRTKDGWIRIDASRLADPAGALARAGFAADDIEAALAAVERDEAVARLTASGVPAAPARRAAELAADPALAAGEVLHPDPRPGRDGWSTAGRHARFSRTERDDVLVAPSLGEHTREVLAAAGFGDDEIDDLVARGVARAAERREGATAR